MNCYSQKSICNSSLFNLSQGVAVVEEARKE